MTVITPSADVTYCEPKRNFVTLQRPNDRRITHVVESSSIYYFAHLDKTSRAPLYTCYLLLRLRICNAPTTHNKRSTLNRTGRAGSANIVAVCGRFRGASFEGARKIKEGKKKKNLGRMIFLHLRRIVQVVIPSVIEYTPIKAVRCDETTTSLEPSRRTYLVVLIMCGGCFSRPRGRDEG